MFPLTRSPDSGLAYPKEARNGLTRKELGSQLKRFASEFHICVRHCTTIKSTKYDGTRKRWTVLLSTKDGEKALSCTHLVLATGAGFQGPHMPDIPGAEQYGGISIHSAKYKNAEDLAEVGVKVTAQAPDI